MKKYDLVRQSLKQHPKTWLITGVAGFIGSNILEELLGLDQKVVGIDNFSTGYEKNLTEVRNLVTEKQWANFVFIEGDVKNIEDCRRAMTWVGPLGKFNVDYVLHQAALGSVPRSLEDPIRTNENNVSGFINILVASREAKVSSFTYAASSSTYGDHPGLPKVEEITGRPLSPYAVTKLVNELYAEVFSKCYGFDSIGLRYFNVFGKRQDPNGAYAAVIPKWAGSIINGDDVYINGDGETSRDFCYVANAVQANLLAATANNEAKNQVYNVAVGDRTTLVRLLDYIFSELRASGINYNKTIRNREFRSGDVRHSQASINKAKNILGYNPEFRIESGIAEAMKWYVEEYNK